MKNSDKKAREKYEKLKQFYEEDTYSIIKNRNE